MFGAVFNKKNKYYSTRTFTYYLPAPPPRKSGYQEKEFDLLVLELSKLGFEIISIQATSHQTTDGGGVWILCHLGAPTSEIFNQRINLNIGESGKIQSEEVPMDPSIIHE
ncbi:MAG: hypothetical protein CME62_03740 [Halobacteriovoraceae bacterium]|nr:hypothetical protein [Halobacteriovoraceae bacterium]